MDIQDTDGRNAGDGVTGDREWLALRFEEHRTRLRGVAYRMLGSLAEADDAVQDAWERVDRAGADDVENIAGWLTTIVSRVCLNKLRSRHARRESSLEAHVPDPILSPLGDRDPEEEVLLADSVGLALQVVLETLSPAERLAFVLHDMFDLPFEEISPMVGRSAEATRQLASRARRRVRGAETRPAERDVARQRRVVEAFYAAGRGGDFEALIAVLDPDVVLRADFGPGQMHPSGVVRGSEAVANQARLGARSGAAVHLALVNGAVGAALTLDDEPFAIMAFTIAGDRIIEIDLIGDPDRVARLAGPLLESLRAGGEAGSHEEAGP
jgi:RNA polymerase sigma-70 factor (ECF subfamily)